MAPAIFGAQTLKESSVTGIVSNRTKKNKNATPRPKLDSQRLLALKGSIDFNFIFQNTYLYDIFMIHTINFLLIDILRYWLCKVKKYDEVTIDIEVNLVGKYVGQKIYELNRSKDKLTAVNNNAEAPGNSFAEGI